jgi:hypothetical protein
MKLVLLDAFDKPLDRLKGTTAILRRLVNIAEQARAA